MRSPRCAVRFVDSPQRGRGAAPIIREVRRRHAQAGRGPFDRLPGNHYCVLVVRTPGERRVLVA